MDFRRGGGGSDGGGGERLPRWKTAVPVPGMVRFDSFSDEEVERRRQRPRRQATGQPAPPLRQGSYERVSKTEGPIRSYFKQVPSPPAPPRRRVVPVAEDEEDPDPTNWRSNLQVPSPPLPTRRRRRVSFGDLPDPTTPPGETPRESEFLVPPDDARFYGVSPDRSPRVRYRDIETPSSPSQVPVPPVRPDEAPRRTSESRRSWSREPSVLASGRASVPPPPSGRLGDNKYDYSPLRSQEIRLVEIQPVRMAAIKCNILHYSLDRPPRYTAISYAWGDAGDTRKIQVDGVTVPVAASLYGALEALRGRGSPVLVWVDALCIDQSNRDERTQQVQLMASIYRRAESVAIWLGPEADDSSLAMDLLHNITDRASSPDKVKQLLASMAGKRDVGAVVSLFERDYWRRLWVVQEVFNARSITVYCGARKLPYAVYELASRVFRRHRADLDRYFPANGGKNKRDIVSPNQYTYSQVLVYQGPASLPDLKSIVGLGDESLLEVLRACRRKLAADARDKVYGVLGVLPEDVRKDFTPNYSLSVKDVYTDVVDFLLTTTERVDVICEAIHFPLHTDSASLPSFVPDWSHMPQTASLCSAFDFRAAGATKAQFKFLDDRRNKLQLSAIYLDTIKSQGVAVGTLCTVADYLMAFLHWRALLLGSHSAQDGDYGVQLQEAFCRTICLGQIPGPWKNKAHDWMEACYLVFASLLHERLPFLSLDKDLSRYVNAESKAIRPDDRRRFLQEHFGARMMGRGFCLTVDGRLGMGTGFMAPGDVVIVPLGCDTPILVRPDGNKGEYRFVGDVYINGYMHGKAVEQWRDGQRDVRKYVLH